MLDLTAFISKHGEIAAWSLLDTLAQREGIDLAYGTASLESLWARVVVNPAPKASY